MEIWNIIVQSNAFNFIVFVVIFAIILKAAKIGNKVEAQQEKVKQLVDDSTAAKENSIIDLKTAQEAASRVGKEIKAILDDADLQAMRMTRKILADAHVLSESIIFNADKVNDANGKKIISGLATSTAVASAELAKKHIISTLEKKTQYHAKFIEDSINELDRFNF